MKTVDLKLRMLYYVLYLILHALSDGRASNHSLEEVDDKVILRLQPNLVYVDSVALVEFMDPRLYTKLISLIPIKSFKIKTPSGETNLSPQPQSDKLTMSSGQASLDPRRPSSGIVILETANCIHKISNMTPFFVVTNKSANVDFSNLFLKEFAKREDCAVAFEFLASLPLKYLKIYDHITTSEDRSNLSAGFVKHSDSFKYIENLDLTGTFIQTKSFLKAINKMPLQSLTLHSDLDQDRDSEITFFMELSHNTSLKKLCLKGYNPEDHGLIFQMLYVNKTLYEVDLDGEGDDEDYVSGSKSITINHLCEALKTNRTLQILKMRQPYINDLVPHMIDPLEENNALLELDLTGNLLTANNLTLLINVNLSNAFRNYVRKILFG